MRLFGCILGILWCHINTSIMFIFIFKFQAERATIKQLDMYRKMMKSPRDWDFFKFCVVFLFSWLLLKEDTSFSSEIIFPDSFSVFIGKENLVDLLCNFFVLRLKFEIVFEKIVFVYIFFVFLINYISSIRVVEGKNLVNTEVL